MMGWTENEPDGYDMNGPYWCTPEGGVTHDERTHQELDFEWSNRSSVSHDDNYTRPKKRREKK